MSDISLSYVTPLFRSNADVVNMFIRNRRDALECGELEMNALECLEAYGLRRGHKLCSNFVNDFRECVFGHIQVTVVCLFLFNLFNFILSYLATTSCNHET